MVVGTGTLMNTTHGLLRSGLWLTYLVVLLALLCAALTGCHSHAVAKGPATLAAMTPSETVEANPLAGMMRAPPPVASSLDRMWAPVRTCIKSVSLKMPRAHDLATTPTMGDSG